MHEGLVHSCNAYFAQLAVTLGAGAARRHGGPARDLADAVEDIGAARARHPSADRIRARRRRGDADADGSSGGGDRVRRTCCARRIRSDRRSRSAEPDRFLDRNASRLLAGYMRDVVLTGTGRSLKGHPWRIAGKTGTAELTGRASHAWFVGFAPYGTATRRIAFAVIIENAGYGGASAAPVAGEIVTAAAQSGSGAMNR